MRPFTLAAFSTTFVALVTSSPIGETNSTLAARTLGQTGHYTIAGLGARKKQLTACGATVLDLAIAMLE